MGLRKSAQEKMESAVRQSRLLPQICFCILMSVSLSAQPKFIGSGGWCFGERYDQHFTNANQEIFVGQVKSIDTVTPYREMSLGIQMQLQTESELVTVHLGPAWYILNQDMVLEVNDENIEVKGCWASINGKKVVIASRFGKANGMGDPERSHSTRTRILRDKDGIPYWCAWRPKM